MVVQPGDPPQAVRESIDCPVGFDRRMTPAVLDLVAIHAYEGSASASMTRLLNAA
jgi:hypothetical protein